MNTFKIVPYLEIEKQYGISLETENAWNLLELPSTINFNIKPDSESMFGDPGNSLFAVYEGDVTLQELNLTLDNKRFLGGNPQTVQPQHRAILVLGNLTVEDYINIYDECAGIGLPNYLYVTGNVKAKRLAMYHQSEMIVKGNADIEQIILFQGHPNTGQFQVIGNLTAKNVYLNYFNFKIAGDLKIEKLYVLTEYEEIQEELNLSEFFITINDTAQAITQCVTPGIKTFPELMDIEEPEELLPHLTTNRIFIDDCYFPEEDDVPGELNADKMLKLALNSNVFKKQSFK